MSRVLFRTKSMRPETQFGTPATRRLISRAGKVASWIALPDRGINNLPVDYEYVRVA